MEQCSFHFILHFKEYSPPQCYYEHQFFESFMEDFIFCWFELAMRGRAHIA
jgi:hypothetical protein